jgi:hypothetical protein
MKLIYLEDRKANTDYFSLPDFSGMIAFFKIIIFAELGQAQVKVGKPVSSLSLPSKFLVRSKCVWPVEQLKLIIFFLPPTPFLPTEVVVGSCNFAWASNSQKYYDSNPMTSEGLGEMFEGDSADICTGNFLFMLIGDDQRVLHVKDPVARTPYRCEREFVSFPFLGTFFD